MHYLYLIKLKEWNLKPPTNTMTDTDNNELNACSSLCSLMLCQTNTYNKVLRGRCDSDRMLDEFYKYLCNKRLLPLNL